MKNETIGKHAQDVGLQGEQLQIFVAFFAQRFPHESEYISSYVREWAERFKAGNPEGYMDTKSKLIYAEVRQ